MDPLPTAIDRYARPKMAQGLLRTPIFDNPQGPLPHVIRRLALCAVAGTQDLAAAADFVSGFCRGGGASLARAATEEPDSPFTRSAQQYCLDVLEALDRGAPYFGVLNALVPDSTVNRRVNGRFSVRRFGERSNLTLKEVVADNLRRLCENDGRSIANMCKAMRISRSQFDRYLAAENLPTEGTAKTIANFFRIAEVDLFQVGFRANIKMPGEFEEALRNLTYLPAPRFRTGIYFLFVKLLSDPAKVMCSIVVVKHFGDNLGFVRLTGHSRVRYSTGAYFRGRHSGLIVERHKWLYFTAVNMVPEYEPSMVMFRWIMGDEDVLPGKASIATERGPVAIDAILQRAPGDLTLQRAVKMARIYPGDAPFIGEEARRYLEASPL